MARVLRKRGEVTKNFPRKAEFVQHVKECLAKAREIYPEFTLQDKELPIVFFQKGHTAGFAKWDNHGIYNIYNVEFNIEAITKNWEDMVNDTIPHEIAHIVDRFINGKCNGHGAEWKRIAQSLGCSGERCHTYNLSSARKKSRKFRYEYIASCGTSIWLTKQMHNKVQNGQTRFLRSTKGKITQEHCTGRTKLVK